jgi:hypothetical protein
MHPFSTLTVDGMVFYILTRHPKSEKDTFIRVGVRFGGSPRWFLGREGTSVGHDVAAVWFKTCEGLIWSLIDGRVMRAII